MEPPDISPRSRLVAFLLAVPLGIFGAHRFYLGKTGSGVAMIFTVGGMGIWWLVDTILIAAGEFRDREGRRVVRWVTDDEVPAAGGRDQRVLEELEQLRHEVFELQERVDFMERTLAQVRQHQGRIEPT